MSFQACCLRHASLELEGNLSRLPHESEVAPARKPEGTLSGQHDHRRSRRPLRIDDRGDRDPEWAPNRAGTPRSFALVRALGPGTESILICLPTWRQSHLRAGRVIWALDFQNQSPIGVRKSNPPRICQMIDV